MVPGSEELRSYWFEAIEFARRDTEMVDGKSYSLWSMASTDGYTPMMTTNYGGPFYIEVGKNQNADGNQFNKTSG